MTYEEFEKQASAVLDRLPDHVREVCEEIGGIIASVNPDEIFPEDIRAALMAQVEIIDLMKEPSENN